MTLNWLALCLQKQKYSKVRTECLIILWNLIKYKMCVLNYLLLYLFIVLESVRVILYANIVSIFIPRLIHSWSVVRRWSRVGKFSNWKYALHLQFISAQTGKNLDIVEQCRHCQQYSNLQMGFIYKQFHPLTFSEFTFGFYCIYIYNYYSTPKRLYATFSCGDLRHT